ncbi:MAG: NAD(P)/FAD-dependent oxidoreductase [Acidobacteriota bacterium]
MSWDAVVVGARCAGAPLARFLARAGKRVLLLDAAKFPSDKPLSTHVIQPYGMEILDELGLGDRVRAVAPPITTFVQALGPHAANIELPVGACCPRRVDLDALLLDGAREAGAEVRLQHRVVELVRDGERVAGVVAEQPDGSRCELRASVVVGADGSASTVAELAGAEEYFAYDNPRGAYWGYYPRPPWYGDDPGYRGATLLHFDGLLMRWAFPTNRDQILIGAGFPIADAPRWRADPRGVLEATLREHPRFARLLDGREPIGKLVGILKTRFFFRRAAGKGWALVGDAGLHKDPTPGLGISDALRDARALASAIAGGGSDAALERYWRQRDVDSFELYNFARDMGELAYNNPLNQLAFAKVAAQPALARRIVEVVHRRLSPYEVFKPSEVLRWTFGAVVRGRFGVLPPFFRAARRTAAVKRELERRRRLLVPALTS